MYGRPQPCHCSPLGDPTTFPVPGFSPSFRVGSGDPGTILVPEAFLRLKNHAAAHAGGHLAQKTAHQAPLREHGLQVPAAACPRALQNKRQMLTEASQDVFRASDICE